MKTITLFQPWASLVANGSKKYETRSWSASWRGPILIHAAKKMPGNIIFQEPFYSALKEQHCSDEIGAGIEFPGPCILAICNLVNCLKIVSRNSECAFLENDQCIEGNEFYFGDYTPGRYAWQLENVHQLAKPISAKGMQRIWNWDETPHLATVNIYKIGDIKIWTPCSIISGQICDPNEEGAVKGLEVI